MRIRSGGWVLPALLLVALPVWALAQGYSDYATIGTRLQTIARENPTIVTLSTIGKSAGGRDIWVVRVAGAGAVEPDRRPALFIGANIEGNRLLASEAAVAAIDHLLANAAGDFKGVLASNTFYIAPVLNPDGMVAALGSPTADEPRNTTAINEDGDLTADEDGPEDLNGDGFVTVMRYKHPEGTFITHPEDPRVMKQADGFLGEIGQFRIVSEGIDNDGDGQINEDAAGGVVINRNFPHDFQYFTPGAGPWPASEPETIALLEFFFSHRNIALVYSFGSENNLLNLQRGKQAQAALPAKVKIPNRFARFLGIDPEREFTIKEVVAMVRNTPFARGVDVTEEQVALMLGMGPVMSLNGDDYRYYEEISKRYKEMVKETKVDDEARKPKPVLGDGSFASWVYYHYGVPSFSVDIWAVPAPREEKPKEEGLTVEKLKSMSKDDFLALGEEKIAAFIKAQGMEGRVSATMVINMVQGGQTTPAQMAQMIEARAGAQKPADKKGKPEESTLLDWAEKNVPGGGFIAWTPFKHPTLGDVEIGGVKPMVGINPPVAEAEKIIAPNVAFAVKLAEQLPRIEIADANVTALGAGLYEVEAWVVNHGWWPTALRHGITNRAVPPIVVKFEMQGGELLNGQVINRIPTIAGHGRSQKLTWIVRGAKGAKIALSADSAKSGADAETLVLP